MLPTPSRAWLGLLGIALALSVCVGTLGRGYWTPDEPREADIAWRMSWQPDKAVPLLAGEAFCEKPPLTYWVAGAAIRAWGKDAWVARLPNLLYALVTALAVGAIGRRAAGAIAGWVAAAAITTFLLSYQVAIWLATDAPLLAAVAVALLGLYKGFYASGTSERLRGYSCMHAALAVGFLSKSAAAWMVPVLTLAALVVWEKRWRELKRFELYVGLGLQALLILTWVWFVYAGPDGLAHLKVFFWNNLVGRFTHVDAPDDLQYTAGHKNSPAKYLVELPVYLWPWVLLVAAAVRTAWQRRQGSMENLRPVRFALAAFVPTLLVLSFAATARNIYLAPALPGVALLLGWWAQGLIVRSDRWDRWVVRATAALLLLAVLAVTAAVGIVGADSWDSSRSNWSFAAVSVVGILAAAGFALSAWRSAGLGYVLRGLAALLLAYCALLVGPASQIYRRVDGWQDLAAIGAALRRDADRRPLILFGPDETTRAFVDMYARPAVGIIPTPLTPLSAERLKERLVRQPQSLVLAQIPGRNDSAALRHIAGRLGLVRLLAPPPDADPMPEWASDAALHRVQLYALPNGRRYALFELLPVTASR